MKHSQDKPLSICLIGCGEMGRLHARSIAAHRNISRFAVSDADNTRAEETAHQLKAESLSVDEALEEAEFDAVFVVSPPSEHLNHTLRAAQTGAYVFCEKPLGPNLASIDAVYLDLKPFGDKIHLGFNRRFDPHMAALKARVDAGEVGRVEQLHIVSRDHTPPTIEALKTAAGLIAETAIHDFDMARWLLGTEPAEVSCHGAALVNPDYAAHGHIDTATTILTSAVGQQVVIQNSLRANYGYDQRVEAFGAGGRLAVANPVTPLVAREDGNGLMHASISDDWSTRYVESYRIEVQSFLSTVRAGLATSPNLFDGYMASLIAQNAQASLDTGRRVRNRSLETVLPIERPLSDP